MQKPRSISIPSLEEVRKFSPEHMVDLLTQASGVVQQLNQEVQQLQSRVDWFIRQVFGQKSERRQFELPGQQLLLTDVLNGEAKKPETPPEEQAIPRKPAARTRKTNNDGTEDNLFFDETKVPIKIIELPAETDGLTEDQYVVISEKFSHRLAQRPGSYVILKYVRPVIKVKATGEIATPPAPQGVIEGSRADVSLIAAILIEKFGYHLPLYRQHLRMQDAGINVTRAWLTQLVTQAAFLLEPIYQAQLTSIISSRVKSMDETPIKAGRAEPGKLKGGYFWPIYGEADEICFPFCESRETRHVEALLGMKPGTKDVLLTDGYTAYQRYAEKTGITHAQCWAHTRRKFFEAQTDEPVAGQALDLIGEIYQVEADIRAKGLTGTDKQAWRKQHAQPRVDRFFRWVADTFEQHGLLPSGRLTKALAYARERRSGLSVFLDDPDVPVDTNHLERALRPIPMGRRNWLFCWTEAGAKQVGIMQSLIATCRIQGIDPYDYLVDVLLRVSQHPASRVEELTPRQWKTRFADNPMRSDLQQITP